MTGEKLQAMARMARDGADAARHARVQLENVNVFTAVALEHGYNGTDVKTALRAAKRAVEHAQMALASAQSLRDALALPFGVVRTGDDGK